ncbi:Glycosyltransferase involved in cell wall bisynthesis [Lishizhenia tianjinensis]|uniref:Glycosyltransferase involved in cell wall bisynthesis n=1 Tax=Lishizhenia tianjinensis TaxID=477690 RepID=A0A1I6Y3Y7_9FLAO|nr:glycosyltransferase [Lishizhenia tianjinensis]SFT45176.1 Glycosyltransferase involved in cell wall bisynthesis [Lishizhenia tianjinensis]
MKIAYLSVFYPYRGGIAHFNYDLCKAFMMHHEVKVFNFSLQYPNFLFPGTTQYLEEGNDATKIENDRVLNSVNPLSYFSAAKAIKSYDPDLLVIGYWMPFVGPSLGTVAGLVRKKCKVVSVVHNAIPHETKIIDKPFTKYFLKRNSGLIALSKAVEDDIKKLHPTAKTTVVKHPDYTHFGDPISKEEARRILDIPQEDKVLLFFGIIREYKGLKLLLETMKELPEDYTLLCVGEVYGDDTEYREILKHPSLTKRVRFINDYVPDSEVKNYFCASDVNILPYKSATQSGISFIANQFNLPLIVTDVGGLRECIVEGKTGLLVKERTQENLKASILEYFEKGYMESFVANMQAEKDENSWENMGKKIVEFAKNL